jgi:hypothetical protein
MCCVNLVESMPVKLPPKPQRGERQHSVQAMK